MSAPRVDGLDAELPGSGARPRSRPVTESRVTAPFGRRVVEVQHRDEYGPYVVLSCADPDGPLPAAGQFYMLSAQERWGGGEDERPFLPRAFSVLRARRGRAEQGGGAYLQFMLEDVGPGTQRLCELRAGDGLGLVGPLGQGFRAARQGRRALLVGGGVGIAPLAIWRDALGSDTAPCSAFATAPTRPGRSLLPGAVVATDDGSHGHPGLVTELLEARAGP